jgi:hypothetical protein
MKELRGEKLMNKKKYLLIIGIVAAAVAISILSYSMLVSHGPTIASLEAPETVIPSGSCQVVCNATEPDGDELRYGWSTTGGAIAGEGATITWTAPQSVGSYNVTVIVIDGRGGEVTDYVTITVKAPPTIEKLTVTAKEPTYLVTTSSGYTVARAKQYDIACNVSDTSGGVFYHWFCESGVISGEGSTITWTAPDESLTSTMVTVIVSDVAGNMVPKSIVFRVASCTSCTFG